MISKDMFDPSQMNVCILSLTLSFGDLMGEIFMMGFK